jgi:hypothetical protein
MQRELTAFVEQPCKETFLSARKAVLSESSLPLTTTEIAELDELLEEGEFEVVLDRIDALPPSKVLSPRVHFLAAEAADGLHDAAAVELERILFVLSLRGLLTTGDGTRGNPFVVCHPSDEYDILAAMGRRPAGQMLKKQGRRLLDVILCEDGCETCFDVTEILSRPQPKPIKVRRKARARRPLKAR